jgi:hypothetical protein
VDRVEGFAKPRGLFFVFFLHAGCFAYHSK